MPTDIERIPETYQFYFRQAPENQGLLGQSHHFRKLADDEKLNRLKEAILNSEENANWEEKKKAYENLAGYAGICWEEFKTAKEKILLNDLNPLNQNGFERASIRFLLTLEAVIQSQEKLADALFVNKRLHKANFSERLEYLTTGKSFFSARIQEFEKSLSIVSVTIIDHQIADPNPERVINVRGAIDNLHTSYKKSYEDHNFFWRWLKTTFLQKSDRVWEIAFLRNVSDHPDCTDGLRMQAIALVRNKIIESELFGQGSNLRAILAKLGGSAMHPSEEDETLAEFLRTHRTIVLPQSLEDYYVGHSEDYQDTTAVFCV